MADSHTGCGGPVPDDFDRPRDRRERVLPDGVTLEMRPELGGCQWAAREAATRRGGRFNLGTRDGPSLQRVQPRGAALLGQPQTAGG